MPPLDLAGLRRGLASENTQKSPVLSVESQDIPKHQDSDWVCTRGQGCIGVRGASPQSSILRCNVDTLSCVDWTVNDSRKLRFILPGRLESSFAIRSVTSFVSVRDYWIGLGVEVTGSENLVVPGVIRRQLVMETRPCSNPFGGNFLRFRACQ
jgi:hypothetical protein